MREPRRGGVSRRTVCSDPPAALRAVFSRGRRRTVGASGIADWSSTPAHPHEGGGIAGCSGTAGVPVLAASGAPILGNRDFGLTLANGRPNAAAAVGVSAASANIPLGTCMLLVQPPSIDLPLRLDTN